jgi:hypothetical protein
MSDKVQPGNDPEEFITKRHAGGIGPLPPRHFGQHGATDRPHVGFAWGTVTSLLGVVQRKDGFQSTPDSLITTPLSTLTWIINKCNANTASFTLAFGECYTNDTGLDGKMFFTCSETFKVNEIEVFEITDSTTPTKSCSPALPELTVSENRSKMCEPPF